jgi:addiction module HigA family antidote
MSEQTIDPIHPGEHLAEFLDEFGISEERLATAIGVPRQRIGQILMGQESITADMALRLSRFFGNSPEFWMNLQVHYDLEWTAEALKDDLAEIPSHAA